LSGRLLHHQLKAIFDPEFAIDTVKMNFDGSLADAEAMRNCFVPQAFRN
jgi:hypothetical protein